MITGIRYAIAQGADVINLSMNGPERSLALEETLAAAKAAGIWWWPRPATTARNRDATPSYPASAPGGLTLAVAAQSPDGGLATFSGYGRSVPLAAPGQDVLSTATGGAYASQLGHLDRHRPGQRRRRPAGGRPPHGRPRPDPRRPGGRRAAHDAWTRRWWAAAARWTPRWPWPG